MCIHRKFLPISPPALSGKNFTTLIFCPVLKVDPYRIGEFFFREPLDELGEIFIQ